MLLTPENCRFQARSLNKAENSLPVAADMTGQSLRADGGSAMSRSLIPVCLWGPRADTPGAVFFRDYQARTWTHQGGLGQPTTYSSRGERPNGSDWGP